MQRLGLALSGGGFRATIYHLGVVRLLRDAGILPRITHITSVSGGSVLGAHLALHWDRYCGSEQDFEDAAQEIIRFSQLDVRNRIVRRFPFASSVNQLRSLLRMRPSRQLTRAGLLENHYEKFLFGDVPLSQLPDRPRLQIMSTNLSEGCLCAFNQKGLLLQRRALGRRDRFERVEMGLATVPLAVAASSAFPGFFPPLEIAGDDVGAEAGEFQRQAFTDGGVYDNLGLRMFWHMEQSWIREQTPLSKQDFYNLDDLVTAHAMAKELPDNTPISAIRDRLADYDRRTGDQSDDQNDRADHLIKGLWEIIRSDELHRDPRLQHVEMSDPSAQSLLSYAVSSKRSLDLGDRLWLNRKIIDAAIRQVTGKPCLRSGKHEFDGILVSDAGGKFKVTRSARAGGLVRTALRSSDILMDRVRQLELESFENKSGALFFPITDLVTESQDATAASEEVQRQAAKMRTDMDQFSDLEISTLIRHGYCVARKALRSRAGEFDVEVPPTAPWDPLKHSGKSELLPGSKNAALQQARLLRRSSSRRVASTLLSLRDWPSYVWIVLALFLLVSLPYYIYKLHKQAALHQMIINGVAAMSSDYRMILELVETDPFRPHDSLPVQDVESVEPPDYSGFEVISDSRIFDLRAWSDPSRGIPAASYARLDVKRKQDEIGDGQLRLQRVSDLETMSMNCFSRNLAPVLYRTQTDDGRYLFQLNLDFSRVPLDKRTELLTSRSLNAEIASTDDLTGRFNFTIRAKTGLLQVWLLLPENRSYDSFEVTSMPLEGDGPAETVVPYSKTRIALGSIATFRLINPDPRMYECVWEYAQSSR